MEQIEKKMNTAIAHFEKELNSLRTSRANPSMLDNITVDAYGAKTPLNQLGNISIPDSSTITIQVWDSTLTKTIENAIVDSNLGINPQIDGQIIRLRIPDLTEERRKDLIKILKNMGEKGRVAIRNIRREANEELKKQLKDKQISEDQNKSFEKNIQKLTDNSIENLEKILVEKEKEIIQI